MTTSGPRFSRGPGTAEPHGGAATSPHVGAAQAFLLDPLDRLHHRFQALDFFTGRAERQFAHRFLYDAELPAEAGNAALDRALDAAIAGLVDADQ